ncbi:hypothetical protein IFM89_011203 [Coptis chinensis]|uniref:Uncharacterized protein n=1 Tax=Coptis chinensis TaxID=261450 RepID=A0A835HH90_9MAGN|nr:hypothetical protein IFM89_011203 [Coptis chinensis]
MVECMATYKQIFPTVLFLCICVGLSTYAENLTLPDCASRCGNLSIPYPFGIGKGCYRDKGFEVLCRSNDSILVPYLGVTGSLILELSMDRVRVQGWSVTNCFDRSGNGDRKTVMLNPSSSPFTFSNTQNILSAFGCDIFAYITDPDDIQMTYLTGCVSLCNSRTINLNVPNGTCAGIGCCQIEIPSGLKAFKLKVDSINIQNRLRASDFNGCSFAAVDDGQFSNTAKLATSYMTGSLNYTGSSSAVLDWAIGEETCEEAKRNASNFACKDNSKCIDSSNGQGYQCRCLEGFRGNPYLLRGCRGYNKQSDIDECQGPNQCKEGAVCVNKAGSYYCDCPTGYKGDGRKIGLGCIRSGAQDRTVTRKALIIVIGLGIGSGLLVLPAVGFWLYRVIRENKQIKQKQKFFKRNGGLLLEQQISSREGNVDQTKIFVTEELNRATDDFNESRILGTGASGTVYKGMLTDGRIVAIKKSKIMDESQIGQFINELVILSQINHRNVVKLLGCCLETKVPLLVYEYISNGTLSHYIHDDLLKLSISWKCRLQICKEIAGALSYLHSSASTPIFHRDIKSNNILLDENYRAKVCDFGISRSVPFDQTHLTTMVQGTFGYLDPEYFQSGQFTEKSDVYSFGIVLVELLTGQKPISFTRSENEKNLAMHFILSLKQDRLYQILEALVLENASREEVLIVAKLAKRCLKLVGKKRPTMNEVMTELEGLKKFQEQM